MSHSTTQFTADGAPGRKLAVDHLPLPNDDPTRRRPDYTRARQRLAWRPRVSLPDGLRKTVEYFCQAEATVATKRTG